MNYKMEIPLDILEIVESFMVKPKMNVQQALWHIIEKIHFYEFDFTDEFIEMIKTNPEYDGLYDILNLSICKKFNMIKNSQKEIVTSNPYILVQQLIKGLNSHQSIFKFEENYNLNKQKLVMLYEEIDKIFEENKDNIEPHTNILILLSYKYAVASLELNKYINNPIIQKCMAFDNMIKASLTNNIDLIKEQTDIFEKKYPNVATRWIKTHITKIQMINDKQDIKCLSKCTDILFPNKYMTMYKELLYFRNLCVNLHRMRLEKKYEYADYISDIPPYDDFTDMFNHYIQTVRLTFESDIKKDNSNYISYLKNMLENDSKFISDITITDYVSQLNNNGNFSEVYNIFKKYKNYIIHILNTKLNNTLMKLTLIYVIIRSGFNTNKNISKKEFNEIIANIKPEDYVDTGIIKFRYEQINSIINKIERRNNAITILGFDIVDRSKLDETCLICLEEIDDTNTETILCICCKKEIGHINCVCDWIKSKQTCPNCRSGILQRISMRE